jgi:uncharacterized membrane protein
MNLDRIFNILGLIVVLGIVTTLVAHKNTANVVSAFGSAFSGSLRAAMGR